MNSKPRPQHPDDPASLYDQIFAHQQPVQGNVISDTKKSIDPISSNIINRIDFRLMGYADNDDVLSRESLQRDASRVMRIEKKLVINPLELKEEFRKIREATGDEKVYLREHSSFESTGKHTYPVPEEILYRVRREGWVLLAGIVGDDGKFHEVGYNFGLDTMPQTDDDFMMLSRHTLYLHPESGESEFDPKKVLVNWRTGIAEDIDAETLRQSGIPIPEEIQRVNLRRLGIASAIKEIVALYALELKKDQIHFNIADLYDVHSAEKLRNGPSFKHNTRIFESDYAYRTWSQHLSIKKPFGYFEKVAKIRWRARGDTPQNALANLEKPDSKLRVAGWSSGKIRRAWADLIERQDWEDWNNIDNPN